MRLIDSDAEVYGYVETWICNCSGFGRQSVMAVEDISYLPEIDPETLPIVQELRKELERVTAEREAAVSDLEFTKICSHCKNCNSLILPIPKVCQECTHGSKWEWRGIQEAQNDEQI